MRQLADGDDFVAVVSNLIERHGGFPGLALLFRQHGLRYVIRSWVEPGASLPISPEQLQRIFGIEILWALASQAGMQPRDFTRKLSLLLPQVINRLSGEQRAQATVH